MATKKVGKAAMHAARKSAVSASKKPLPKKGEMVWVSTDGLGVNGIFGIFVGYSVRAKVLTLRWSAGSLLPYIWPVASKSIFNVERGDIRILSPEEILSKIDWMIRRRDEQMRNQAVKSVAASIGNRLFSD